MKTKQVELFTTNNITLKEVELLHKFLDLGLKMIKKQRRKDKFIFNSKNNKAYSKEELYNLQTKICELELDIRKQMIGACTKTIFDMAKT